MATPQSKFCASKHCDNIIDNKRTSPRRRNMHQNATNETNWSPSDDDAPTVGIHRYDTPKVNDDGMIIIPRDVIRPTTETWTEDYISACLPYHPALKHPLSLWGYCMYTMVMRVLDM